MAALPLQLFFLTSDNVWTNCLKVFQSDRQNYKDSFVSSWYKSTLTKKTDKKKGTSHFNNAGTQSVLNSCGLWRRRRRRRWPAIGSCKWSHFLFFIANKRQMYLHTGLQCQVVQPFNHSNNMATTFDYIRSELRALRRFHITEFTWRKLKGFWSSTNTSLHFRPMTVITTAWN